MYNLRSFYFMAVCLFFFFSMTCSDFIWYMAMDSTEIVILIFSPVLHALLLVPSILLGAVCLAEEDDFP